MKHGNELQRKEVQGDKELYQPKAESEQDKKGTDKETDFFFNFGTCCNIFWELGGKLDRLENLMRTYEAHWYLKCKGRPAAQKFSLLFSVVSKQKLLKWQN